MNYIYKFNPSTRLVIGILLSLIGFLFPKIIELMEMNISSPGFFGGIILGLGIALILTHRVKK